MFFFSESIMSDESDLNCFKGHILNEEIDRAKAIFLSRVLFVVVVVFPGCWNNQGVRLTARN